jgi:hypothetical protein
MALGRSYVLEYVAESVLAYIAPADHSVYFQAIPRVCGKTRQRVREPRSLHWLQFGGGPGYLVYVADDLQNARRT